MENNDKSSSSISSQTELTPVVSTDNPAAGSDNMATPPQFHPRKSRRKVNAALIIVLTVAAAVFLALGVAWWVYLEDQKGAVDDSRSAAQEVVATEEENGGYAQETEEESYSYPAEEKVQEAKEEKKEQELPLRSVGAYICDDEGNRYPVIFEYTLNDDGTVAGRYAYNSTLRKNGNKPSSWITIKGTYDRRLSETKMNLRSYLHGKTEPFESLNVSLTSRSISGTLTNYNTGARFYVEPD